MITIVKNIKSIYDFYVFKNECSVENEVENEVESEVRRMEVNDIIKWLRENVSKSDERDKVVNKIVDLEVKRVAVKASLEASREIVKMYSRDGKVDIETIDEILKELVKVCKEEEYQ